MYRNEDNDVTFTAADHDEIGRQAVDGAVFGGRGHRPARGSLAQEYRFGPYHEAIRNHELRLVCTNPDDGGATRYAVSCRGVELGLVRVTDTWVWEFTPSSTAFEGWPSPSLDHLVQSLIELYGLRIGLVGEDDPPRAADGRHAGSSVDIVVTHGQSRDELVLDLHTRAMAFDDPRLRWWLHDMLSLVHPVPGLRAPLGDGDGG